MASESSITTSGYIKHHLQNLTYGEKQVETAAGIWEPTGELGFATTGQEAAQMGFLGNQRGYDVTFNRAGYVDDVVLPECCKNDIDRRPFSSTKLCRNDYRIY